MDTVPRFPSSGTPNRSSGQVYCKPLNLDLLAPIGTTAAQQYQATKPVADVFQSFFGGGLSSWEELALRALEAIAGFALILSVFAVDACREIAFADGRGV